MDYYGFPLKLGAISNETEFKKRMESLKSGQFEDTRSIQNTEYDSNIALYQVNLERSIAQLIYLILTTKFDEYRFDHTFGCALWEFDFENIASVNQWKDAISNSVRVSIERHEPRLANVRVRIEIGQEEILVGTKRKMNRLKKCVDITVNGTVVLTNELFKGYKQRLYISPFSFD